MTGLRIDPERCTGHGRCYDIAPDLFDCDDEGHGQVVAAARLDGDRLDQARQAVALCPEHAVALEH